MNFANRQRKDSLIPKPSIGTDKKSRLDIEKIEIENSGKKARKLSPSPVKFFTGFQYKDSNLNIDVKKDVGFDSPIKTKKSAKKASVGRKRDSRNIIIHEAEPAYANVPIKSPDFVKTNFPRHQKFSFARRSRKLAHNQQTPETQAQTQPSPMNQ